MISSTVYCDVMTMRSYKTNYKANEQNIYEVAVQVAREKA
jgi:hypothetical protein